MNAFTYRYLLFPARAIYRRVFKPKTRGVKVFIQYKNEILLIKNSYGARNKWNLPGGGVAKHEPLAVAAKREVKEELGIKLKNLKKLGSFLNTKEHINDTVTIFFSKVTNKNLKINNSEIREINWIAKKDLKSLPDKFFTLEQALKLLR